MKQSAAERPDPSLLRKAAIAEGAALDHTGRVLVKPIPDFGLKGTIFDTLQGAAARFVMKTRIGKEPHWFVRDAEAVEAAYDKVRAAQPLPAIKPELLRFLIEECDFDVEHAEGSFLDHLYFCFEYSALHYPQRSPLVSLLHSILGTGTNTFAMDVSKIPALRAHLSEFEWRQIEAFPSVLRLLYDEPLRAELRENVGRLTSIERIEMRRVIDNAPITLSGEEFLIALNYQLIHLIDFLPAANWSTHANDTAFIIFRDLFAILERSGTLEAKIRYEAPSLRWRAPTGEKASVPALLTTLIPIPVSAKMAARALQNFSAQIGHSLGYYIRWVP